jgi:hypothetical protein
MILIMENTATRVTMGAVLLAGQISTAQETTRVWQKPEIALTASQSFSNPYADVEVWVDMDGPGYSKRCYGFWDGGNTWRVRIMATAPGTWTWTSGSSPADSGLAGRTGSFSAVAWSESELQQNPLRRGMVRATANGHALQYADGTPMFWLADTWWSCMTRRFFWYDDDLPREVGTSAAGFKDYVRYRKAQGYNGCMVIAGFPNWTDTSSSWGGTGWEDEAGNRPFFGPGTTPDLNRINPAYFQSMDKKVDYLNENGFIPFIETARRDIGAYWKANFGWPHSYARYIRYLCFRYQGNIIINSPVHLDLDIPEIGNSEWNQAANVIVDGYAWPPFGHLGSANPPSQTGSTLESFGHTDQVRWLSLHAVGNARNHFLFPDLTAMFEHGNPVPCLNNEPYYDGLKWGDTAALGSDLAAYYCRVGIYGSVLSGGLAGHAYGADHVWDGDSQMPMAFVIQSAAQMQHIRTFLFGRGATFQNMAPRKDLLTPRQTSNRDGNKGWAYCLLSGQHDAALLYFEQGCERATLSGCLAGTPYHLRWFKPATGEWIAGETLQADGSGKIVLPLFPGGSSVSTADWGVELALEGAPPVTALRSDGEARLGVAP